MTAKVQPAQSTQADLESAQPNKVCAAASPLPYTQAASPEEDPQKSCCSARRILIALVFAFVGATSCLVAIWLRGYFNQQTPPGIEGTKEWYTEGNDGLEIVVLNALEDKWTPVFDEYIEAWDKGEPDALTLTSFKVSHDVDCTPVDGKIKVCNGDYGDTNWRGINEAFIRWGHIQYSAARMNDYVLDRESEAFKSYTMCHELGHAFGLPHTDEDFNNFDRGDCLDYTNRPRVNLSPGEHNFNLLAQMYGTVDDDGTRRRLGAPNLSNDEPSDTVAQKYAEALACLESKSCAECNEKPEHDVRMLHENDKEESCKVDLGEGYSIRINKLLVA